MQPGIGDGGPSAARGTATASRAEDATHRQAIADRVLQSSVDGILAFDRHLHITAWNPSMEELFGLTADEVVGRSIFAVLPCFLQNGEAPRFRATLEGDAPVSHGCPFSVERTGRTGLVDCHYSPLRDEDGATSGGLAIFRDRTRTSDVALALRDAREQFTELFEHAPIGMAVIEMDGARIGTFLRVNDALCRITGRAAGELTGRTVIAVTDPADAPAEVALAGRMLTGELPRYRLEKRLRHAGGAVVWVAAGVALLRSADGIARHSILQVEEITPVHALRGGIETAAEPLPGVSSRAVFDDVVRRQVADAARHRHPGAVVVLRLDGLAHIDETLGRDAGDEAIRRIAELLGRRIRETDVVAAPARGEFGVVLRLADLHTAELVAAELARQISSTPVVARGGEELAVSASFGVAPTGPQAGAPDAVLSRAREARRAGRVRKNGPPAGDGAAPTAGAV
jgi:diguanylate cyclase (GGDEF)-like protein/PAS domain S-box-containing protein